MKTTILNRDFQHPPDGWYQIEVPGEHLNKDAGIIQVIDRPAVESVVNHFNQEADDYQRQHGIPFPGMLIDHEHFKHDPDKETRAYGWLMSLENRNGIPFGKINWTNTGKPAIDGGDYRFFSTEYDSKNLQVLNRNQKPLRVRPLRLDGLTLTNDPNNKGGAPITNRADATNPKSEPGDLFPTSALDEWFQAVAAIQGNAKINVKTAIDFNTAWEMARQQFPELYLAAFGVVEQSNATDDSKVASEQVGALANRITKASRGGFDFGWNFVRENLPIVFNRMFAHSEMILNREKEKRDSQALRKKAAGLFSRLARAEEASSGLSLTHAWWRVKNRHPALSRLMDGSITLEAACAQEPELKSRLM